MVSLTGNDDSGKAIYLEQSGEKHITKAKVLVVSKSKNR
jgi:hypothetical protein